MTRWRGAGVALALAVLLLAALAALRPPEDGSGPRPDGVETATLRSSLVSVTAPPGAATEPASLAEGPASVGLEAADPLDDPAAWAAVDLLVVYRSGAPAAGAEVVFSWRGEKRAPVRTGPDGRVELRSPAGTVAVVARAPGAADARWAVNLLPRQRAAKTLELVPAGGVLRGLVVDLDDRPVAGATVQTLYGEASATTDAQGGFALEGLTEARHTLEVEAPGHMPGWALGFAEPPPGPIERVVLRPRVQLEGRIVVVPPGSDAPTAWTVQSGAWDEAVVVDADGRFVAEVPGGEDVQILVQGVDARGGRWAVSRDLHTERSGVTQVTFEVPGPAAVSGRVVRRGGGLAGLHVNVEALGGHHADRVEVAADGAFALSNIPSGRCRLVVETLGVDAGRARTEVELRPGATTEVELVVDDAWDVAGVVVGPDGAPARARVRLGRDGAMRGEVRSDATGRFEVRALQAGRWWLVADWWESDEPGLMSPPLELRVGADARTDDLRLVLGPAGRVSGRVVDAAGVPVPGAPLLGGLPGWTDGPQVTSDPSGRFTIERLPPGPVELQLLGLKTTPRVARRRGVAATRCDPVRAEVRAGETTEVVVRVVDDPGGR